MSLGGVAIDPGGIVFHDGSIFASLFNGAASGVPAVASVDTVLLDGGDAGDLVVCFDVPVVLGGARFEP